MTCIWVCLAGVLCYGEYCGVGVLGVDSWVFGLRVASWSVFYCDFVFVCCRLLDLEDCGLRCFEGFDYW